MSNRTFLDVLTHEGIADLTGFWTQDTIADWNDRLDPLLALTTGEPRSYLSGDHLARIGIVDELFNDDLRAVVSGLYADPVFFHCHVYEIAAGQSRPHIQPLDLRGWHRDPETVRRYSPTFPNFVSVFVALSPIGEDDGAFEFVPAAPVSSLSRGAPIVRLTGRPGTAAAWNRSYYHRASPNRGPVRRRLLKISVQPRHLPNDRIALAEFVAARSILQDPYLRHLCDASGVGAGPATTAEGGADGACPLEPTGTVELSLADMGIHQVFSLAKRFRPVPA